MYDPVEPSHAEWYLLLSRCYAEGYGVKIDHALMISNLKKAAEHESIEAKFMLALIEGHFNKSALEKKATQTSITVNGTAIFQEPVENASRR